MSLTGHSPTVIQGRSVDELKWILKQYVVSLKQSRKYYFLPAEFLHFYWLYCHLQDDLQDDKKQAFIINEHLSPKIQTVEVTQR